MCVLLATAAKYKEEIRMTDEVMDDIYKTVLNREKKVILEWVVQCRTSRRNGNESNMS